jgi:RND family efflux transporter MFP subunit
MNRGHLLLGALLLVLGCHSHEHAEEESRPGVSITRFAPKTELFVEFPALVVGAESPFAAHLTNLETFKPLLSGKVTVALSGGGSPEEQFVSEGPTSPGIFRPVASPAHAGSRELSVLVSADGIEERHDLGTVEVFPSLSEVTVGEEPEKGPAITFLKEQQWRVPFATEPVGKRMLRESLRAYGVLRPRADGEARITAPVTGRIITMPPEMPTLGTAVTAETVLVQLAPRISADTDPAELERAVERAKRDLEQARRERARLEALFRTEAVPERRVLSARHDELDAESDYQAALHRQRQYQGIHRTSDGEPAGRITVRSPIPGTLVGVHVAPGEFVEEGRVLFEVVDLDRLWLEVHIPEADIAKARKATGAWFEVSGFPEPFQATPESGGRVIAMSGVVDSESRTSSLVVEAPNGDRALRAGMFADVRVLSGEAKETMAVPVSAILDEAGESVVYVEQGGESFERRPLELGGRDGDFVEVLSGLSPGERVVTKGAYYIRLASSSGAVPAHGHAH